MPLCVEVNVLWQKGLLNRFGGSYLQQGFESLPLRHQQLTGSSVPILDEEAVGDFVGGETTPRSKLACFRVLLAKRCQ